MLKQCICKICHDGAINILQIRKIPPLQNRFFNNFEEAQNFLQVDVNYLWCDKCQHISIYKNQSHEFDRDYDNDQTASLLMIEQYQSIVSDIVMQVPSRNASIIEIGCGRGYFLEILRDAGYIHLKGYDPAAPTGTEIISNSYWDGTSDAGGIDLVIVRHTLEEMQKPNNFVESIVRSLNYNGRIYCEVTNAPYLLNNNRVFSLYPEYENMFSVNSLSKIYAQNGLSVEKITTINGAEWVGVWGIKNQFPYSAHMKNNLMYIREKILKMPKPIVLWGGAGRGGNILSFLQIDLKDIGYVVDLNRSKQGQFIPPYGQKVISPDQLKELKPATIIVANGKYKNEICQQAPSNCLVVSVDELM